MSLNDFLVLFFNSVDQSKNLSRVVTLEKVLEEFKTNEFTKVSDPYTNQLAEELRQYMDGTWDMHGLRVRADQLLKNWLGAYLADHDGELVFKRKPYGLRYLSYEIKIERYDDVYNRITTCSSDMIQGQKEYIPVGQYGAFASRCTSFNPNLRSIGGFPEPFAIEETV